MFNSKNKILGLAVILACLISTLHIFFCFDAYDDIAACYALMVRAFADGEFNKAFAVNLPILSTSAAGLLTHTGMGPFRTLVVVSCLFYLASIPVLYYILKYFLKREDHAAWGCVLFVLAPKIIRFSCTGLLNPAKNFFIISAVALILASAKRLKWLHTVLLGIVLAGLALARAETIVFLPLLVLWYAYFIFIDKKNELKKRLIKIFLHCLVITVMFFICISPRLYQSYKAIGVPTLDIRQASYVSKVLPFVKKDYNVKLYIMAERKTVIPDTKSKRGWAKIWQGVECFTRGAYIPYFVLALLGIYLWWKKKRDRAEAFMLFSIIALNAAVLITISNSVRYYTINLIMFLPFTFIGLEFVWNLLVSFKKFFKPVLIIGLIALAAYQITNGSKQAIKRKFDYEYKTGFFIEANKDKYCPSQSRLIIAATQPQFALWADAIWLNISDNKIQFTEQLNYIKGADFVVLEDDQSDAIEILKRQKEFKLLEQEYPQVLVFVNRRGEKK
jgi:hypothetical protein